MLKFFAFCIAMGMLMCYGWEEAAYKAAEWSHSVHERGNRIRAEIRRRYPEPKPEKHEVTPRTRRLVRRHQEPQGLTEQEWRALRERGQEL